MFPATPAAMGPLTFFPPVSMTTTTRRCAPTSLNEPTHVAGGLEIRAGAGLAEDGLGSVVAGAPGGAEIDGAAHAELDIVDAGGSELEGMFHLGIEVVDVLLRARVLQIVHGAAIGDGAEHGGELQGRLG